MRPKPFIPILVIALFLAALSSVLSIIGPNKLSDLTDELSKGLVVDKENLINITSDITSTLNEKNFKDISSDIMNIKLDNETIIMINNSDDISSEDKLIFNAFLKNVSSYPKEELLKEVVKLPNSITNVILPSSMIDNVLVSSSDKISFINMVSNTNLTNQKLMIKQ